MNILENSIFPNKKPISAHGHPTIELWEPHSRKVVQKVEGDNMVFTAAMLSRSSIFSAISSDWLCLMDNDTAIDANFPYLLGQVVGYGIPSTGSSGNYQGAYNVASQMLAAQSLTSIRWKFQYDFTTAQANGIIKSLGLTSQFKTTGYRYRPKFSPVYNSLCTSYQQYTCDGRYSYKCTASTGVVTKYDNWLGIETTIDVSAIIGKTSTGTIVGYEPANGRYHIFAYTSGASRWYVFSDATFATCVANYNPTSLTGYSSVNLYIYGTKAYLFTGSNAKWVDYVNNITWTAIGTPPACNATTIGFTNFEYGTCPIYGNIVAGGYGPYNAAMGVFLDISTGTFVGYILPPQSWNANIPAFKVPLLDTNAITVNTPNDSGIYTAATAAYKLPTPVTKTSANGMTVTYELEVFWQ